MYEEFLQFIWEQKLFPLDSLRATNGENITVIHQGYRNTDSGPDFFNSRIRLGNMEWAGNVEIHVNASDWYKHGHQNDYAYDNVILHVVDNPNEEIVTKSGRTVPTLKLPYDEALLENYESLLRKHKWVACENRIRRIEPQIVKLYLPSLAVERLGRKSEAIRAALAHNQNDWEETFYQFLVRSFGFRANNMPFEVLTRTLPYKYIARQRDSLLQAEALLFGQAGMLETADSTDEYVIKLKGEYTFLQNKYGIKPMAQGMWKFSRMRPANFPSLRIAQLASLLHTNPKILSKVLDSKNYAEILGIFSSEPSEYWQTHYSFNAPSPLQVNRLGEDSSESIIINTVAPFLFVYGKYRGEEEHCEKGISLLESCPPEDNAITRKWKELGLNSANALETQALIQLKNNYCTSRRCLSCPIGSKLIKMKKPSTTIQGQ